MCLFKDAELNWVSTNILDMLEFRQLEIGMSTSRYFPAMGTAGLERVTVNGNKREPCPPPNTTEITFEDINQNELYKSIYCFAERSHEKSSVMLRLNNARRALVFA